LLSPKLRGHVHVMSRHEPELRRRLVSDEPIEETTVWYMHRVAADKLKWSDMSVFEVRFLKQVYVAYEQWWATRTLH
jgi:hypothetical protein